MKLVKLCVDVLKLVSLPVKTVKYRLVLKQIASSKKNMTDTGSIHSKVGSNWRRASEHVQTILDSNQIKFKRLNQISAKQSPLSISLTFPFPFGPQYAKNNSNECTNC